MLFNTLASFVFRYNERGGRRKGKQSLDLRIWWPFSLVYPVSNVCARLFLQISKTERTLTAVRSDFKYFQRRRQENIIQEDIRKGNIFTDVRCNYLSSSHSHGRCQESTGLLKYQITSQVKYQTVFYHDTYGRETISVPRCDI